MTKIWKKEFEREFSQEDFQKDLFSYSAVCKSKLGLPEVSEGLIQEKLKN